MIKPTVGRVVWVIRPDFTDDIKQPEAAFIAYVHNDRMINVAGFTHQGNHFSHTSVPLLQDDDEKPQGTFAVWMPFQVGQAAKAERDARDEAALPAELRRQDRDRPDNGSTKQGQ